ncbi:gamma-glutamyl cyclotransferase [Cricetulus griseus]
MGRRPQWAGDGADGPITVVGPRQQDGSQSAARSLLSSARCSALARGCRRAAPAAALARSPVLARRCWRGQADMASSGCEDHAGQEGETFLYFAYGSNLLTERIHLRNPSAVFCCVARLQDFKLDFGNFQGKTSERWHGGIATIFQSPGDEVWGVVWKMNKSNLSSLDEQEGVKSGVYVVIEIKVSTQEGKEITCRSYLMTNYESAPPSPQYKKVICMGAKENGLPLEYQEKLKAIEPNDYKGKISDEMEEIIKKGESKLLRLTSLPSRVRALVEVTGFGWHFRGVGGGPWLSAAVAELARRVPSVPPQGELGDLPTTAPQGRLVQPSGGGGGGGSGRGRVKGSPSPPRPPAPPHPLPGAHPSPGSARRRSRGSRQFPFPDRASRRVHPALQLLLSHRIRDPSPWIPTPLATALPGRRSQSPVCQLGCFEPMMS